MPIVQTADFSDFRDAFKRMGRENQFTNLEWLFDYLEQLSEETGQYIELDVIALCCEYTEESWDDVAQNYPVDLPDRGDYYVPEDFIAGYNAAGEAIYDGRYVIDEEAYDEAKREAIREYLEDNTFLVNHDDETVMYAVF